MIGLNKFFSSSRGFTLVEVLIATSLFLMGMMLVSLLFMTFLRDNDRLLTEQSLSYNGRFILESMAKAIREKSIDTVSGDTLSFQDGTLFFWNSASLLKDGASLHDSDITVARVNFVRDAASLQPLVLISFRLEKDYRDKTEIMDFQTTLSSRVYE